MSSNKDFGYWMKLFKTDPQRAERERVEEIEKYISSVPSGRQARLRGLQWTIDQERAKHTNAFGSAIALFNKMWKKVYGKDGLSDALNGLLEPDKVSHTSNIAPVADVVRVDFSRKKEEKK